MKKNSYYITTTLPYVNAEPHIGFAIEILQADCIARYHRQLGYDVFHNFGTDEHGIKIYRKAQEQKKDPKTYVDEYSKTFTKLKDALNINYDAFIRTTDLNHKKAAQHFWNICNKKGDIYKKTYKTKYCIGCELEKTDSELIKGTCEFHPTTKLEIIQEENYFFRFSNYQEKLLAFYKNNPDFVIPAKRFNEIIEFVKNGLQDFSVSRLKTKMPWGIPVPNDSDHVMYVWFDALINYISTLGWPNDMQKYLSFWPGVQIAGKDNLRQQSAIWQAMLMSAELPLSKQIFIHGFISVNGQRMSKTTGNVISPYELVDTYGTEATRYYLLTQVHPYEDSDFTYEKFIKSYNANLANGLGNLVSRVAKLCEKISYSQENTSNETIFEDIIQPLQNYRFDHAAEYIWKKISDVDQVIEQARPWELSEDKLKHFLPKPVNAIRSIAYNIYPYLPDTSNKITKQFSGNIKSSTPLFPRIK
ncbi:methionine--tRNA ligase [Patescibacteria group bacterium]